MSTAAARAIAGKYIAFTLAGDRYGMPIELVREVLGLLPITRVPNTPAFVLGLVNRHGRPVPVVDLRLKLRLPQPPLAAHACILVLTVPWRERHFPIGMVVEGVHDIRTIAAAEIGPPPAAGARLDPRYLVGVVAGADHQALLLLHALRALTDSALEPARQTAAAPSAPPL